MSAPDEPNSETDSTAAIELDSPAKIVSATRHPSEDNELPALPVLPPRENTAHVSPDIKIQIPPDLPPRDTPSTSASSPAVVGPIDPEAPALPARSPKQDRRIHESVHALKEKESRAAKSLVQHETAHYLVISQAQLLEKFGNFLEEQDLVKEDQACTVIKDLEALETDVDFEFWRFLLLHYDEIGSVTDLKLLSKIEGEFSKLDNDTLRHITYLVLSRSIIIDDELYSSLEIDITTEQDLYLQGLSGSDELIKVLSKFVTVEAAIPSPVIIQIAKAALTIPQFTASDVFKLTVSFNFQFKKVVAPEAGEYNPLFLFQLSRALEDNAPKFLLALTKAVGADKVLQTLGTVLTDPSFAIAYFSHFTGPTLFKLFDALLLKGFQTLIIILTKLVKFQEEKLIQLLAINYDAFVEFTRSTEFATPMTAIEFYALQIPISLYKYKEEFRVITNYEEPIYPRWSVEKLKKAALNNEKLSSLQEELQTKYNQILSNYQQLNEEKFTNETYIKPLSVKKMDLSNQSRALFNDYETRSKNLEILKINNARNEEVERANESLTEQIREMNEQVEELRIKISQARGNKK